MYRVNKTVETFVISTCIWIVYLQAIDDATCIAFGEVILYLSNYMISFVSDSVGFGRGH